MAHSSGRGSQFIATCTLRNALCPFSSLSSSQSQRWISAGVHSTCSAVHAVIQTLLQVRVRVGQGGLRLGLLPAGHGEAPPGAGKICKKSAGGGFGKMLRRISRDMSC
ncbi:hypothetical protein CCH79_00003348 [Gambusia affinis]|uniref:Uncharacterized protein n=1 Tax=Gambusia affinis TaxID=33528 RepID=A0A315VF68_GAMAF|nr:hypothetical protein CCH79_00003348 [Gambusia affinis]